MLQNFEACGRLYLMHFSLGAKTLDLNIILTKGLFIYALNLREQGLLDTELFSSKIKT